MNNTDVTFTNPVPVMTTLVPEPPLVGAKPLIECNAEMFAVSTFEFTIAVGLAMAMTMFGLRVEVAPVACVHAPAPPAPSA